MRRATPALMTLGLALLAGCPSPITPNSGAAGEAGAAGSANRDAGPRCSKPLPVEQPTLASAPAAALPESLLAITVRAPLARLREEIERRVPVQLAAGGRGVGALGRLSYSVRREQVALRLETGKLLVDIPVKGYAEVCMPIGSACPRLSSCSPALVMTAAIPLALTAEHRFGPSEVSVNITRGCTIAGIDATSRFSGAASQQAAAAGRRIDQALPSLRPEIEAAWTGLGQPMPLATGACLLATPRRLVQAPPTIEDDELTFHLGIGATLRREPACRAVDSPAAPASLPKPERVATLDPSSDLAIASERPWSEVARELDRAVGLGAARTDRAGPTSMVAPPIGPSIEPPAGLTSLSVIEARAVAGSPSPLLAVRLVLAGERCGEVWLGAAPRPSPTPWSVALHAPRPLGGQPGRVAALAGLGLERWIEARARIDVDQAIGPAALAAIRQRIEEAARLRASDASVEAESSPSSHDRVLAAPAGLSSVERLRASIGIELR